MDATSWAARLFTASKRYQSSPQTQSRDGIKWDAFDAEALMGFEDIEMDDETQEYHCPFCSEYSDIVGLCCHIDDEHPVESSNGICPVCAMRVGVDMVAHITVQHSNIFKLKRKSRKAFANSTLSLFKKEMREANFRSLFGGSSRSTTSSTSVTADPLLSSFILPMVEEGEGTQSNPVMEPAKKIAADITSERKSSAMSMKDKEEKSKRCKFVQDLVFSAVLDDN